MHVDSHHQRIIAKTFNLQQKCLSHTPPTKWSNQNLPPAMPRASNSTAVCVWRAGSLNVSLHIGVSHQPLQNTITGQFHYRI